MFTDQLESFPRRLATSRRFTLGAPRSFRVSKDGDTVLFLRSGGGHDPVNSLWVQRRGAGEAEVLFDGAGTGGGDESLSDAERARRERAREQASGVVSYMPSKDFDFAYFVLGGELNEVAVADGTHRTMTTADSVFDPRPRPGAGGEDRREVAYVSGRELRLTDGENDRVVPGTAEDDELVSWGSAEFVAAEEMDRQRGFWWAPDGTQLVAARVDVSPVCEWWISSPEDPSREPRAIRYPAAGTDNADVELWLVDPDDGPTVRIDWQDGTFEYLVDVKWNDRLLLSVKTRDQTLVAVLEVDPGSGAAERVAEFEDDRWVEPGPGSLTDHDGDLAMVVDDDRSRRLFVDGVPLTPPDEQVRQLVGRSGDDWVIVSSQHATSAVVGRVDSNGVVEQLSDPSGWAGAAAGGGTIVVSQATAGDATTHEVRWDDGSSTEIESLADGPGFDCTPEFLTVGERNLNVALCLPSGHDGSPLPVLMDPYGGPHAQRVVRARNAFATSQWFAEQGFAVVIVDGRGTPGRGPAFEREVWGDLASPILEDQIDALEALASDRPEIDADRVGIRGWSFGGYLAALAVMRRPDVFHAAVAGAPVTDWRLYDTHYTECYLGHPDEHPYNYERSGLLNEAAGLGGPLMLIHGLADDNVVAAHTLVLSRALLEAGQPHQVLPLSGVTHMTPQEQVAENLLLLQRDFLLEHVAGSAHPAH